MNIPPPSYTTRPTTNLNGLDTTAALPLYTFPTTFNIGIRRTNAPLVDSAQLKGHLALLCAFARLRLRVDEFDDRTVLPFMPEDKERRWTWFVGLAVERFERWILSMGIYNAHEKRLDDILPPLDVIMVWHAYMLNPGWYAEDCNRIPSLAVLKGLGGILAASIHRLSNILGSAPSETRVRTWSSRTLRAFDPMEDAVRQVTRTIICPLCRNPVEAPLMTSEGKGYLQQNFGIDCPNSSCTDMPTITKNVLGARKLAENLVRSGPPMHSCLAGTLHTPELELNAKRAKNLKDIIMQAQHFARPKGSNEEQWIVSILKQHKFSLGHIRATIVDNMRAGGAKLISRMLNAYTDDKIFSVELIGAVLRQGSFVMKMHRLQWTEPGYFQSAEDEIALQHAIARYHAFLDLMQSSPVSFFVPTLDIDLAWHTHQLMSRKYNADTRLYVGRFVDHDDKVEEDRLASAFDITCRAWEDKFHVQYTYCGCPLPGETIGQKLSRLAGIYSRSPSYLVPLEREDLLAATHPSDHNAVFAYHQKHVSEALQKERRKKFEKRRKRDEQLAKEGKLNPKQVDRGRAHDPAFLVPVPIYYMYGPVIVGCVAGTGNVVNNTGGVCGNTCAAGVGNCGTSGCGSGGGDGGGSSGGDGGGGSCGGGCGGGCGG